MAATAGAKHFGVQVITYFAVQCINIAITVSTISNYNSTVAEVDKLELTSPIMQDARTCICHHVYITSLQ